MQKLTQDGILVMVDSCGPRYGSLVSIKCREFIEHFLAQERPILVAFFFIVVVDVVGSSHILTPEDFLSNLQKLSNQ